MEYRPADAGRSPGNAMLNQRAAELCDLAAAEAEALRVRVVRREDGGRTLDFGIEAAGGLNAGLRLAEICLSGLGRVAIVPAARELGGGPAVQVHTDQPLAACMASQYAGWQIVGEKFFAMGSGPMRAAAGKEELFRDIGCTEKADAAVGVLETRKQPPAAVVADLARQCGVMPQSLTLCVAPTASQAGTVQVVARSVETALHKLHELGFDLRRVESGYGVAPLPPVARDDLAGIGRTNDAILYGGEVTLWVRGDDESLSAIGPRVPSSASPDHGEPFATIFERAGRDFYKIDKMLFSPAAIALVNLDTGRTFRYGRLAAEVVARSFAM
jgi:methenyltetrahydromethanopterin cyclohydrolase